MSSNPPPNYIKIIKESDEAIKVLEEDARKWRQALGQQEPNETPEDTRCYAYRLQQVMCAIIGIERTRQTAINALAADGCANTQPCR